MSLTDNFPAALCAEDLVDDPEAVALEELRSDHRTFFVTFARSSCRHAIEIEIGHTTGYRTLPHATAIAPLWVQAVVGTEGSMKCRYAQRSRSSPRYRSSSANGLAATHGFGQPRSTGKRPRMVSFTTEVVPTGPDRLKLSPSIREALHPPRDPQGVCNVWVICNARKGLESCIEGQNIGDHRPFNGCPRRAGLRQ